MILNILMMVAALLIITEKNRMDRDIANLKQDVERLKEDLRISAIAMRGVCSENQRLQERRSENN